MYRFSQIFPNNGGVIQRAVSDHLADLIECVFGKPDDTDIYRLQQFIKFSDAEIFAGDFPGPGTWPSFIYQRYMDMYRKLKDLTRCYTFNEMGEALLVILLEFMAQPAAYLAAYSPERFRKGKYVPLIERAEYPGLDAELEKIGREMYELGIVVGLTSDRYVSFYITAARRMIGSTLGYIDAEYLDDEIKKISKRQGHDARNPFYESIIFWDEDYELILEQLDDLEELDAFLREADMGFMAENLNELLSSRDESWEFGEE